MTLDKLPLGKAATIESVGGEGALRRHFLNMGLTPGTRVTLRKTAPMGDPIELELRGYELTLRLEDAKNIIIGEPGEPGGAPAVARTAIPPIPHPGHGEKKRAALAADTPLVFALAGNQNCGKTTLFNQLTGSNQHVGNFPGVTVDRKDGQIRKHPQA
ncbi:MAG TPA: FeoA domain-containing protein, partial [Candidatus Fournierella merdipullorum]|nr:FeoA domain-containing protein [Candidatus Fournierella merdipullorum]